MKKVLYKLLPVIVFVLSLSGCTSVSTNHISDYGAFLNSKYGLRTVEGFYPENLENVEEVRQYSFEYKVGFPDDEVQVVLDCVYSAEQYAAEVARIKALDYSYSYYPADERSRFYYPAYAMSVNEGDYEYVLLLEDESRMVYVHLEYYPSTMIKFDKSFLPKGYEW